MYVLVTCVGWNKAARRTTQSAMNRKPIICRFFSPNL